MTRSIIRTLFGISSMCLILIAGCLENPADPANPATPPLSPTNLTAIQLNDTTVHLEWDASLTPSDSILYYILSVTGKEDIILTKTYSSYDVSGLMPDSIYTFELRTKSIAHKLSDSATVQATIISLRPKPPTNIRANSQSGGVTLKWTTSTSADDEDFTGYILTITPDGGDPLPAIALPKTAVQQQILNLSFGLVYTFALQATTTKASSIASIIRWAPAVRYTDKRFFEKSELYNTGFTLSTGDYLPVGNSSEWDFSFDIDTSGGTPAYLIGSPGLSPFTYPDGHRITFVSQKVIEKVNSLDEVFDSEALGSPDSPLIPDTERIINFTNADPTSGFIFFLKTQDGNYAKLLVKSKKGKILQGKAPYRYIEMDISYQTRANAPYALRRNTNSGNPPFITIPSPFKKYH